MYNNVSTSGSVAGSGPAETNAHTRARAYCKRTLTDQPKTFIHTIIPFSEKCHFALFRRPFQGTADAIPKNTARIHGPTPRPRIQLVLIVLVRVPAVLPSTCVLLQAPRQLSSAAVCCTSVRQNRRPKHDKAVKVNYAAPPSSKPIRWCDCPKQVIRNAYALRPSALNNRTDMKLNTWTIYLSVLTNHTNSRCDCCTLVNVLNTHLGV